MGGARAIAALIAGLLVAAGAWPGVAPAQEASRQVSSPILTIDSERVFRSTIFGQRVSADIEA